MPTTRAPNSDDLKGVQSAVMALPSAWGCVGPNGKLRPSLPRHAMWVMMNVTADQMSRLWRHAAIGVDAKSSFVDMQNSSQHVVCVTFTKVKKSFFGSQWCGTISLDYGKRHIDLGAVAGNTQVQMWESFRAFLASGETLHNTTELALAALPGKK